MEYYLPHDWVAQLNNRKSVHFVDLNGNEVGGKINIRSDGEPYLYNLMGCSEVIYLDRLFATAENDAKAQFTTKGSAMFVTFESLDHYDKLTREWGV